MAKSKRKTNKAGWSAIPGEKLTVDIDPKKAEHPDDDTNDISKWTSPHYNLEDDDNNSAASKDLYDPDPKADGNRFNVEDGAVDFGMFYSLEVISGDSYRLEKSGDDKNGFVTKVVMTDKDNQTKSTEVQVDTSTKVKSKTSKEKQLKQKKADEDISKNSAKDASKRFEAPMKQSEADVPIDVSTGKPLNKRQRQQLKRKARLDAENANKKTKLESEDKADSSSTKQFSKDPQHKSDKEIPAPTQAQLISLQTAWTTPLHTTLLSSLHTMNYTYPTPIQSATLSAAILGRRDIVGAAPTGSGKTLSYGLPILQWLLENADKGGTSDDNAVEKVKRLPLQALILVPTRELAIQVTNELTRVSSNQVGIGTIVGGFAEVKQRRVLERKRPPVLVCTPGRLWELMSSNEYSHLNNLAQLRFVVVDEADRMIKQGSFPQLKQIFEVINQANPPPFNDDQDEESDDDDDDDRLQSLKGVRGEAKVVMLDDSILAAIERERNGGGSVKPKPIEMSDDDYLEQMNEEDISEDDSSSEEEGVHRQTFVYSATLTLPPSSHHNIKKSASIGKAKKKKGKKGNPTTVDGAIAEILEFAGARGELKIVDLSNLMPEGQHQQTKKTKAAAESDVTSKQSSAQTSSIATRLPPGLSLGEVRCAQRHKDGHLYAYLVTTQQGASGPCLVFCNSIAAVRRVGETLKLLGLPVKMLHAQMAQKSRMSALESLRTPKCRSVVVSSDVAARGLDIPSVATVIHYDVARSIDTFIHRSGRTARGVGDKAVGVSISLVAPAEEKEHRKICEAVKGSGQGNLETTDIDARLLSEAQARVALANKIFTCNDAQSQAIKKNKWLNDTAHEAGLDVDEDMLESSMLDGDQQDRARFLESKRAKVKLRLLLQTPMRTQRFGKYLSQPGLQDAIKTESEVKPFVVNSKTSRGKKAKKKGQGKVSSKN
ncbi:hypothetical protein ACHAXN_002943 [Cyclotella atomus]